MAKKENEKLEKKPQKQKLTPKEKAEKKAKHKNKVELSKDIAQSITASKQVDKALKTKKLAAIMGFIIAFVLVITSIVYIMLVNIEPNNIKITTSTDIKGQSLALTFDGLNDATWSNQLYCDGPDKMWDVSYNPVYGREHVYTIEEVQAMLVSENPTIGNMSGESYIAGMYCIKNDTNQSQLVRTTMSLEFNNKGLHEACRVLVGTVRRSNDNINLEYVPSYDEDGNEIQKEESEIRQLTKEYDASVEVYAALSYNERLQNSAINKLASRTLETGLLEYIAYPMSSTDVNTSIEEIDVAATESDRLKGYKTTVPFESDDRIFSKYEKLEAGEYMYVFIEVWFEGSDFECVDSKLGGYVKLEMDNKLCDENTYRIKNLEYLDIKMEDVLAYLDVRKEEGKSYTTTMNLEDIGIVTLEQKKTLINYYIDSPRSINYWTLDIKDGEESAAEEFLNSCLNFTDIATYLTRYARINNYITLN